MNLDNYDKAISQAQQEINQKKQVAENIVTKFKQVAQAFLVEFADNLVNRAVTEKPDVVASLGNKKINELKKAISEVLATFQDETNKRIENVPWAHRTDIQGDLEGEYYSISHVLPTKTIELADNEIRQLIGKIGSLLVQSGLAKTGSEWQLKGANIQYSYGLPDHTGFPNGAQLRELRQQYLANFGELFKATKALRKAELDKKVAQAKDLWNSA